jgi:hypothetical protein
LGIAQITDDTWRRLKAQNPELKDGDRTNPAVAIPLMVDMVEENYAILQNRGIPTTEANQRIAYIHGARGFTELWRAAHDNLTIGDLGNIRKKKAYANKKPGMTDDTSVEEYLTYWRERFEDKTS